MTAGLVIVFAFSYWIVMSLTMAIAWLVQQRGGNTGWIDVFWTFGVAIAAVGVTAATSAMGDTQLSRILLAALLAIVWALRLGGHIIVRTRGVSTDPRYRHLEETWGATAGRNMFWLLQAQAALSVPLGLSIVLAAANPDPLWRILDALAVVLYAAGLVGSAVADIQLRAFKKHAPNAICTIGLWAWSRHPNYFFEWLVWVSYALFAANLTGAYPLGWLALTGPVCMYWLLRHVSGVPPLEAHMIRKYGGKFRQYKHATSAFFPLPHFRATRNDP